jgi:HSP20 family protein
MESRRNPFRGLMDHMSEMNRMRQYFESGGQEDQRRSHANAWIPTTDIFARGDDLVIRCELAGVRREDLDVSFSSGVLTISGERTSGLEEEELTYYTRERSFGHFRRSVSLPESVDESNVSATFEDGLLEIHIENGAALPAPKHIEIG